MHVALVLTTALLLAGKAHAAERILDFASILDVYPDATLQVTEKITVRAEGRSIKRGIYRDFPTVMTDRFGDRFRVTFEVVDVLRNGQSEAWHTQPYDRGTRVYIGRKERTIPHGEHTYTLVYRSERQLRYFDNHDELYWNVTGNDWAFPIDHASARVRLPQSVPEEDLQLDGYTGPRGAQGQNWDGRIDLNGDVLFETIRPLPLGHGLTIAVGWPKGHVYEPTTGERVGFLLRDNLGLAAGLIGALIVFAWYLYAWRAVGRDPESGVAFPRYEPPEGYSPASLRFVERMGYDHKAFTAALVNLAVKGHIEIDQEGKKYTVTRTGNECEKLAPGEKTLLKNLFGSLLSVELDRSNRTKIRSALKTHEVSLRDYEKRYFLTNQVWLLPGWVLSAITFVVALLLAPQEGAIFVGLFMSVWLTGWSAGTWGLLANVAGMARRADDLLDYVLIVPMLLFSLPFVGGWFFGVFMLAEATSYSYVVLIVGLVAINILFHRLMKAPTRAGRKLLDAAEGFRLYLDVAEGDELALKSPPEKTPELFERYLPYAIALDVEDRWAERFASVLAAATVADGSSGYRPRWYRGSSWNVGDPGRFASGLGSSLGSAVASSSSSSSGVGGGGSSGGGGGGGGGGGW
jgi:uncharacterized membrane protein YgcG